MRCSVEPSAGEETATGGSPIAPTARSGPFRSRSRRPADSPGAAWPCRCGPGCGRGRSRSSWAAAGGWVPRGLARRSGGQTARRPLIFCCQLSGRTVLAISRSQTPSRVRSMRSRIGCSCLTIRRPSPISLRLRPLPLFPVAPAPRPRSCPLSAARHPSIRSKRPNISRQVTGSSLEIEERLPHRLVLDRREQHGAHQVVHVDGVAPGPSPPLIRICRPVRRDLSTVSVHTPPQGP